MPDFVLVTPANVQEPVAGWLMVLMSALLFSFRVWVVYADAAYFTRRFFWAVFNLLGAHPAVDYNLRRCGKRQSVKPFFMGQWQRPVLRPRQDIGLHFAWVKRYFGLTSCQCFTFQRVCQFVLLTYIAVVAVPFVLAGLALWEDLQAIQASLARCLTWREEPHLRLWHDTLAQLCARFCRGATGSSLGGDPPHRPRRGALAHQDGAGAGR